MLEQISLLAGLRFTKACRHVEKHLSKAAAAPATATLDQARVKTARRLMREWELASTFEEHRAAVVAQVKIFLKSEQKAEEKVEEAKHEEAKQAEAEEPEQDIGIDARGRGAKRRSQARSGIQAPGTDPKKFQDVPP